MRNAWNARKQRRTEAELDNARRQGNMKKKYNVALVPGNSSESVVNLSSQFFSASAGYLLGEQSLPHVTLYQFLSDPNDITEIIQNLRSSKISRSIDLVFYHFSYITFDDTIYWASLLPDRINELNAMHRQVADIISHPIKENYDPHMTLLSTRDKNYVSLFESTEKTYTPIMDTFTLSIGKSDNIGQLIEVVHQFNQERE